MTHRHSTMQRAVLAATSLSYVIVILDTSIVNVALARIALALHTQVAGLQWVTNAYTLSFACLLLTGGMLGDRCGARRVYLAGLLVFTLASALCGMAPTLSCLILARILQGIGSAMLVPCSLTLIKHAFAAPAERAGAIGVWAGCGGAAMAAGPLLGGVLVQLFGWRSIFLANLPLGLIAAWLTWRIRHVEFDLPSAPRQRLDLAGQSSLAVALGSLIGSLVEAPALGWTAPPILAGLAVSLLGVTLFLRLESQRPHAMVPLWLFNSGPFNGSAIVSMASALTFYGLVFVLSLDYQQVRDFSSLDTGLAFLPLTATVAAGSMLSNRLVKACGTRRLVTAALAGYGVGFLGLLGSLRFAPTAPYWLTALPMLAIGLSAGLITPAATATMMAAIGKDRAGVAAGVLNAARQTGAALGVAVFGALLTVRPYFAAGLHAALWLATAVSLAAAIAWQFALAPTSAAAEQVGRDTA